ncbi:hypothetical protein IMG5_165740 [Ichthyophthirius multifiliis]|uniref:ADP/ATP translocase n=1 Tax=Ichthyophthirius multifiliis TaxID=5932 RepID=G0R0N4_ICHMU|nr:hypothetical protein IMG5_165740 [Ichthyophthirius multifiliis]EGR28978.1 hypothetical protein IMG5_165740 [Ichthyophthirius multifiliis]|eukprot:XP_004030214.1 hypothetical protein IMG5_165740 [Ichthyophthirius multifiliis]
MMCDLDRSSLSKNSTILKALMSTDNENKFYQGFSISIIGSFLYRGIQYGVYDLLVNMGLSQWYLQVPLSISLTLFAQCTTYPIDTIRRYLMVTGTQFQVEYGKPTDIIRRMQLAESGQLLYGIEYQIGKSIVSGLFMFTYKGLEQGFFKQPDIEGGYQI